MATVLDPFATVADLTNALGLPDPIIGSAEYRQIEDALSDASDDLRDIVGQAINQGESTVRVRVSPGGIARVPAVPLTAVESVLRDGRAVGFEILDSASLLIPTCCASIVSITYTHGWDPVPGIFRKWTKVLAASALAAAKSGNLGLSGGLASVAVDDGRVTWATAAGENGAGVMLPQRVIDRLRANYGAPAVTVEQL